jgi:D-lactate dehydrogenase
MRVSELLRKVNYFADLDDRTLDLLQGQLQSVSFEPGQTICTEDEAADRMFIIEQGRIAVLKRGEDDAQVQIAVLEPGDVAGANSLFGQGRRSATLRALTSARAWALGHAAFQGLLDAHPALARPVLRSLSRQLDQGGALVAKLLSQDSDHRFKIVFFDSKPYVRAVFQSRNRYRYHFEFIEARLSVETAALATGSRVVCAFVNDNLDARVVDALYAAGVELIAMRCAGYNNVDLRACARHAMSVVRVPAYSPHAVAEHTVALMLTLNRRVHRAHNRVREANFSLDGLLGFDMHGKTAGVIGTGKIGRCLLDILAGFGCRLLAHDKYPDDGLARKLGVSYVTLERLFAESDIISLHAPLLPETRHLIDAAAIELMKPGVMLINTSRGALLDTQALIAGLKSGKIGYAGLDVYEEESEYFFEDYSDRVMTDDLLARLTTFNNVLVTSHQGFFTCEALGNIADTTLENIREFELGKRGSQLTNPVSCAD